VLSKLADQLTNANNIELARAVVPTPDPANAGDLLAAATRLMKQGDRDAASREALAASKVALTTQRDPTAPLGKWIDYTLLLGRISGVLAELGAYDEAIVTVQPIEIVNRQQYYLNVMRAEVQHKDAAAITHTLPLAISAITLPTPGIRSVNILYELTRVLAAGGYFEEARVSYQAILAVSNSPSAKPQDRLQPWQSAALKAAAGDLAGALSDADNAGPLVAKPSAMQVMMLAAMQFDNPTKKPTESEMLAAIERAKAALPPLVSGPKANALRAIASELAAQGKIDDALQVVAGLDVEPQDVLNSVRGTALLSIAKAQAKAGDLHGSFSTVMQITPLLLRWDTLLTLAAKPVKQ
jgi:tetratricopeptide (TPR) repeat protein